MIPAVIGAAIEAAKIVIDRVVPDKNAAEAAKREAEKLGDDHAFQERMAQLTVNAEEAKSPDRFISGWRPAVGWIGAISLALVYWPKAIFLSGIWLAQSIEILRHAADITQIVLPSYPDLGLTDLIGLLGSILGIGGMRTIEKYTNSEGNR